MGADAEQDFFSTERGGGTHVKRTGDIGVFKILSEAAVGSGVRRIEALTGAGARAYFAATEKALQEAAKELKSQPADVPARVKSLLDERRKLERELADARKKLAMGGGAASGAGSSDVEDINGVKFSGRVLEDVPAKELKGLVDDIKKQIGSGVVAVISNTDGKASLVVGVTDDLTAKLDAVALVRAGAEAVGGKGGGGRPDMAQAGGPDGSRAAEALAAIKAAV
jgi:alanyl-tRNA synthetase